MCECNTEELDQTGPEAVWFGSTLFAQCPFCPNVCGLVEYTDYTPSQKYNTIKKVQDTVIVNKDVTLR